MYLTEELLEELTGLDGRDLFVFYLAYKKQASNTMLYDDINYTKQDIIKFRDNIYNKDNKLDIKYMINLWECKFNCQMVQIS